SLTLTTPAVLELERGVPAPLVVTVRNPGGVDASDVVARIDLPAGLFFDGGEGPGWSCPATSGSNSTVVCRRDALGADELATLTAQVRTQGNADGAEIRVTAEADGVAEVAPAVTTVRMVEAGL